MIKINGVEFEYKILEGKTVAQYIAESKFDVTRIAIEKNGEILPKVKYSETLFADGDSLEVVSFVGGG